MTGCGFVLLRTICGQSGLGQVGLGGPSYGNLSRKQDWFKYQGVLWRLVDLAEASGKPDLVDLDHAFVDDYRHRRLADHAGAKTIYDDVVLIRQLVNLAMTRHLLPHDPLSGLKVREPKPTPQPCWTPDQMERDLQAAAEPQRSIFTVLAETGARIGEIQWLTWEDIDVDNNVLHIRSKPGWTTKTCNVRAIPMSLRTRQVLDRLPRHARWVFTAPPSRQYPDGTRQISERRLLKSLKRLLVRLSQKGHLHTFRHSFVSRAVMAGTPEAIIRQWVGHVDQDILELYTYVADAQSQAAMRALNPPLPDSDGRSEFSTVSVFLVSAPHEHESSQRLTSTAWGRSGEGGILCSNACRMIPFAATTIFIAIFE